MLNTSSTGRALYGYDDLKQLLSPESVVVVGASEKAGSFGGQVFLNAIGSSNLKVYAVNERSPRVHGREAFRSIRDLPTIPDLAAICVPQAKVLDTLREVAAHGIKSAVVYASGFAEVASEEGRAQQAEMARICTSGLRMLGPNTLGFVNFHRQRELQFIPAFGDDMVRGGIGIASQSGGLGYLLSQAQRRGIGFSHWTSVGNGCDVDVFDLANYMIADEHTKCVVLVLESILSGPRLFEVGQKAAAAGKPVIVYKMGTSERGQQAAQSHTGALTGSTVVARAALKDAGFVVIDHLDELIGTANLFAKYGRARGKGVCFVSASGGAGISTADEAEGAGVPLPPLSDDTRSRLGGILASFTSAANPMDLTSDVVKDLPRLEQALEILRKDPNFALVMMTMTAATPGITGARAPLLSRVAANPGGTPLGVIWLSEWLDGPGAAEMERDPNIALFRSARIATAAIRHWLDWSHRQGVQRPRFASVDMTEPDLAAAQFATDVLGTLSSAQDSSANMDEVEGKQLLRLLGIKTAHPVVLDANDPRGALESLKGLNYPIAVKVLNRRIVHKARVGGVRLHLADPLTALGAALEMAWRLGDEAGPAAVMAESMVQSKSEWFVGARRDPAFGVVLTLGVGGSAVESTQPLILVGEPCAQDIEAELFALSSRQAGLELQNLPSVAKELASAAAAMIRLFHAVPQIQEVDINPLIETDQGLIAVDAVVLASAS